MTTDQIIVLVGVIAGIIGVYWFFLGKHSSSTSEEHADHMNH